MLSKPLWPVVEYAINYDYIVNSLCENRERPESHCNGKCYLAKQLGEESQKEKNPFSNNSELQHFIINEAIAEFTFPQNVPFVETFITAFNPAIFHSQYLTKILHPPQFR